MPVQFGCLIDDAAIREELNDIAESRRSLASMESWSVAPAALAAVLAGTARDPWAEAVALAYARPLLRVSGGGLQTPVSPELRRRLAPALSVIERRVLG